MLALARIMGLHCPLHQEGQARPVVATAKRAHPGDACVVCRPAAISIMLMTVVTFDKCFLPIKGVCQGVGKRPFLNDSSVST